MNVKISAKDTKFIKTKFCKKILIKLISELILTAKFALLF